MHLYRHLVHFRTIKTPSQWFSESEQEAKHEINQIYVRYLTSQTDKLRWRQGQVDKNSLHYSYPIIIGTQHAYKDV